MRLHRPGASGEDAPDSDFAATVASLPPWADGQLPEALPAVDPPSVPDGMASEPPAELAGEPTLQHIGRYALKRKLGEGGLGNVYEAWDPLLSRTVAVKTLQFDLDATERLALDRLFLNEARAVASLNHPHIVTVHDAGLSPQGVYIAMERLVGRDLRQALASGWRPAPAQAALLVRRVADALAYAHARGVVHCDIKPGNIFLTRKDRPTVLDFGIARIAHGAQGSLSAVQPPLEGLVAGSPHYLAPEQLRGEKVDGRTDVYALGVVLYELLAGRKAFEGESLEQITSAVLHVNPAPADTLRPGVPTGLAAVAAKAMARDPEHRFAGAAEMALALRPWQERPVAEDHAAPAASRRHRLAVLLPMLAAAMAIGAGSTWWLRDPEPVAARAAPAPAAMPAAATPAPPVTEAAAVEPSASEAMAAATIPAATVEPVAKAVKAAPVKPRKVAPSAPAPAAAAAPGIVHVAVTPWGQIEVDDRPAGLTPPLTRLELPAGTHRITIRNGDFPPHSTQVEVSADRPVTVRHRFGS